MTIVDSRVGDRFNGRSSGQRQQQRQQQQEQSPVEAALIRSAVQALRRFRVAAEAKRHWSRPRPFRKRKKKNRCRSSASDVRDGLVAVLCEKMVTDGNIFFLKSMSNYGQISGVRTLRGVFSIASSHRPLIGWWRILNRVGVVMRLRNCYRLGHNEIEKLKRMKFTIKIRSVLVSFKEHNIALNQHQKLFLN